MLNSHAALLAVGVCAMCCTGCASTIRQEKEAELAVLSSAVDVSNTELADLQSGALPPKDFDIHLVVSMDLVNRALTALNGYSFSLPNDSSISVVFGLARLESFGASPTLRVRANATKGALNADVDLTAILVPDLNGPPGALRLRPLSFAPKVSWYFFEITKAEFVKALLAVELDKIIDRMPMMQLPIAEDIELGGAARTEVVTVPTGRGSTIDLRVSFPSTQRKRMLHIIRYSFLEGGVHVFGRLQ